MPHLYKDILLLVMLAASFLIVFYKNAFDARGRAALRFLFVVLFVWLYAIVVRLLVVPVDSYLAETPEQIQRIYDGDGAKNAFVAVFGWIPGVIVGGLAWILGRAVRKTSGYLARWRAKEARRK